MTVDLFPADLPVLVIGGGGFLGTNLTDRLIGQGHPVINFSRSWLKRHESPRARYVAPDPDDPHQLNRLAAECCCVFHMAHGSSPATSLHEMEQDLIRSINLTFTLISACVEARAPLFYLSSGGAIYGKDVPVPIPESTATHPISPYGAAKLTAEHYLYLAMLHRGLDYRVLRISNPYGPWQFGYHGQGVIGTWMRKAFQRERIEIWGDGTVVRDYIHVSDVIDSMISIMAYDGLERVFNIGSGEGKSLNDILEHLKSVSDVSLDIHFQPAAPSDVPINVLDTALARQELNWSSRIGLPDGMRQTWAWMKEHVNHNERV